MEWRREKSLCRHFVHHFFVEPPQLRLIFHPIAESVGRRDGFLVLGIQLCTELSDHIEAVVGMTMRSQLLNID